MSGPENDWLVIAIANIRKDIDEIKSEVERVHGVQEELAKKEYAARIVGRIAHRVARILVWCGMAAGGYVLTNWSKIKAFVDGR